MSRPLRIAIIGAGGIAHAHTRAYQAQPAGQCQIVGYADIIADKAEKMAQEFGGQAYTDINEMLSQLKPDAVSVCTPPVYHAEHATLALERGIPVLCEKPFTTDGPSARALAQRARELQVLLMPAHCHRFHGPAQQLKELIATGKMGRLLHFQNRFAFRWEGFQNTWFARKSVAGGGMLLDTTVHSIDLFRYLVGEVAWVSALVSQTVATEVEDSAAILLRSSDGAMGEIACSWVSPPGEATVRLYGTEGTGIIDYGVDQGALRYWTRDTNGWISLPYSGPDRFANEVAHFLECVRTGAEPRVTAEDGARAIEIIDAAYRAAATGSGQKV